MVIYWGVHQTQACLGDKTENQIGNSLFHNFDYWIIKLDAGGNLQWENTIGGDSRDDLFAIEESADGGFLLGGTSFSGISGDKSEPATGSDYWMVKIDGGGNIVWQHTIGGIGGDYMGAIHNTPNDGGYVLFGMSGSPQSGDKTEGSIGSSDYWAVKLTDTFSGTSAFHFEDAWGRQRTVFDCIGFDIFLDGRASKNESHYYIDAWKRPIGSTGNFQWGASLGWDQGQVGIINLTDEFGAIGFTFDPGYEYQIKLAVQNLPFFNWAAQTHEFTVPIQQKLCPLPDDKGPIGGRVNNKTVLDDNANTPLRIYPNPTSGLINISVTEDKITGYELLMLNGLSIKKHELLPSKHLQLNFADVKPGVYLLRLKSENHISRNVRLIIE